MNTVTWFAFGLALADAFVLVLLAAAAVVAFRKAAPLLAMFGTMGGMLGAAAGTGDVENAAAPSPVATPDQCEYEDHEWSPRTSTYGDGVTTHYCLRCGYTEHVPGS